MQFLVDGRPCKRSCTEAQIIDPWSKLVYRRDVDLTGNPLTSRGLESLPDD